MRPPFTLFFESPQSFSYIFIICGPGSVQALCQQIVVIVLSSRPRPFPIPCAFVLIYAPFSLFKFSLVPVIIGPGPLRLRLPSSLHLSLLVFLHSLSSLSLIPFFKGVGAKSSTHAVVCALQRSASKLSSYQQKVFDIDSHTGIAISGPPPILFFALESSPHDKGLTSDARVLCKWLRTETLNYRFVYEGPSLHSISISHLLFIGSLRY